MTVFIGGGRKDVIKSCNLLSVGWCVPMWERDREGGRSEGGSHISLCFVCTKIAHPVEM